MFSVLQRDFFTLYTLYILDKTRIILVHLYNINQLNTTGDSFYRKKKSALCHVMASLTDSFINTNINPSHKIYVQFES